MHEADVAIVGGGVTGCACAYLLSKAGVRTILVEGNQLGRGSTAASTALLMQEPDTDFRDLATRYGREHARRIWKISRRSVRALVDTLSDIDPATNIERLPSVCFTRAGDDAIDLRDEQRVRHRAGLPGRWLSPAALKIITGIEGEGGILTPGNAQVDPYRACLALARGARRHRAQLFAKSPVRRTRARAGGVELELDRGRVRATHVIVATGYATPEFKPLAARFRMMNTYVVATERLSKRLRKELGLDRVMLWDTERPYHYVRWTPDGRLLFGGEDRPHATRKPRRKAVDQHAAALVADLLALYPALAGVKLEYAWEGLFAQTPDGLPYIGSHRRYPRHLFALGYGGNGMTFGFLAAQMLLRAIAGRASADDQLFAFNRHRR